MARVLRISQGVYRAILLGILLLLRPGAAAAQEEQPLQELFFTELVYPQSRHEVQLTFGSLVDRSQGGTSALAYTSRSDQAPWRLGGGALVTPSVVVDPGREWELALGLPIGLRGHHQPGVALHVIKEF